MTRPFAASLALLCGLAVAAPLAHAATFTTIATFEGGTGGAEPYGKLTMVGPRLYGTTLYGGGSTQCFENYGCGTVFSVNAATGASHVLHAFGIESGDGLLPEAGLIKFGNKLYGTTSGTYTASSACNGGCGDLFSFEPSTGSYTIVHPFQDGSDGAEPLASLTNIGGILYGTTQYGGGASYCNSVGCGTIFSFDPKTGSETVLYAFQGPATGYAPSSQLINVNGTLYGMTSAGGSANDGEVFAFNPTSGALTIVHSFTGGTDGTRPADLIKLGGVLYGTTQEGGVTTAGKKMCSKQGCGIIFALNPTTGVETVIHTFLAGLTGYDPIGLTSYQGKLYGTTNGGGSGNCKGNGCGTIYSLDPSTGTFTILYVFTDGTDGRYPIAPMINSNGTFYGTTEIGGSGSCMPLSANGCGTVFAFTP